MKYYYCPLYFIDIDDIPSYQDENELIRCFYHTTMKYHKWFNTYEDLMNYVSKQEHINREYLVDVQFSNNPDNLACQLGLRMIKRLGDKKQTDLFSLFDCEESPVIGFMVHHIKSSN